MNVKLIFIASLALISLLFSSISYSKGDVSVKGYTRADGTYVAPHMRSAPDGVTSNNWTTKGNVNPYTGKEGALNQPINGDSKGDVYVKGYFRADGTYVEPHMRSAPDGVAPNNWTAEGNVNPHTGKEGTLKNQSTQKIKAKPLSTVRAPNLEIPEHAKLDYFGNNWECLRGYRIVGSGCAAVEIPVNAKLDYFGHDWECVRGYRSTGSGCAAVEMPANAKLDYFGHDWECVRGYRSTGSGCAAVEIPANAKLDYFGHDWVCERGYRQSTKQCIQ
jgi:hypothetical protein